MKPSDLNSLLELHAKGVGVQELILTAYLIGKSDAYQELMQDVRKQEAVREFNEMMDRADA